MAQVRISRREMLATSAAATAAALVPASCVDISNSDDAKNASLHFAGLSEVAELIASQELSPVELTQLMLDRVSAIDARLKSYATVMADDATAAARRAEEEIQSGRYRGPLHGVPIAVKDICYTKGVRTMGGLKVLQDFIPDYDATVVSKLRDAGAIILGKLNLTEGANAGYHRDFDIPVNPWGEDLWSGVSSSGSGVATAAGLCFASLGTDTGGSIRYPSAANGIVGLKPTYGRVSRYGVMPLAETLDHVGPMTRRTRDAAIMLEVIAGADINDPTTLKDPPPNMREELDEGVEGLRIGFDREYADRIEDPALVGSIEAALAELEAMGARIIEVNMPAFGRRQGRAWGAISSFEAFAFHKSNYTSRGDEFGTYFGEYLARGAKVTQQDYGEADQVRNEFGRQFRDLLSTIDAFAGPAARVPFRLPPGVQYQGMDAVAEACKFTSWLTFPADFAGVPSLTLPCGLSDTGLPQSIQLTAGPLREPLLCRIGHAYEKATKWHENHPEV